MSEDTKSIEELKLKVGDEVTESEPLQEDSPMNNVKREGVNSFSDIVINENFEVLEFIGKGGTGQVYKVRDKTLDKIFAVKLLRKDLIIDTQTVKRFVQEAETAANLSHPNVVSVYGHGETLDGSPYIIMNYIEGENLAQTLRRLHSLSWLTTVELFIQICDGLEHAHQQGLIHRDLKPSNVLVSTIGGIEFAHVVDFGIAKVMASRGDTLNTLTVSGEFLGTPMYMSPEQCLGQNVDKRTDIYALGCMMFEALNGAGPFAGATSVEMIAKKMSEDSPRLTAEHIPPTMKMVVACCMSRQASDRYSDIASLKEDLKALLVGENPRNAQIKVGVDGNTGGRRMLAAILDYAFITTVTSVTNIFCLIGLALTTTGVKTDPGKSILAGVALIIMFVLPPFLSTLYYVAFEKIRGATLAKQLCGLYITDAAGGNLTWTASLLRNTMKFVIIVILPLLGIVGFFMPQAAWGFLTASVFIGLSGYITVRSIIKHRRLPWDVIAGAQVRRR